MIRAFANADQPAVVALWEQAFEDGAPWNEPGGVIAPRADAQPELFLVGEVQGQVVATALAGFDGVRGWIHHHVAVAPAFRRRGIATALMRAAEVGLPARARPR